MGRQLWRGWTAGLLMAGLVLGSAAYASAAARQYLSFGTGNPGGTFYFIGAGFASLFNKYVPEVRVVAESTAATEENFHLLIRKKMQLGFGGANSIPLALEKNLDMSVIRLLGMGHASTPHWMVRKESPIRTIADFRGRRISVGSPGSGTLVNTRNELQVMAGLTFDDIKPSYLSFTETISALKDGTVDAGVISAGFPVASILDLARQIPLRFVPYTEEGMNTLIRKHPYYVKVTIPAGMYPGIDAATLTRGIPISLYCLKDLNEELVHRMMKAIYDHPREKDVIHPQAAQWSLENIFRGEEYITRYIPFHPGAVQYLKGKGIWKEK